jgi:transposase
VVIRGLLTDEEWAFFAPFVIEGAARGGRPPVDHRRVLDAIFWITRTGAPWRDLPDALGNWNSVHRQFRRWTASGLWDVMLDALSVGGGDAALQMIDSTIVRAHHCAAGARGGLKTRLLAARAAASRPRSTFEPTLRVFRSLSC